MKTCPNCRIRRATKRLSVQVTLDKLAGFLVKQRAGFKCQRCHKPGETNSQGQPIIGLEWAHIKVRRFKGAKWHLDNAMSLCHDCHAYFGTREAEWMRFVDSKFGAGHYERMEQLANRTWDKDLGKILAELRAYEKRRAA